MEFKKLVKESTHMRTHILLTVAASINNTPGVTDT